jgi:hypothetical protein
MLVRQLRDNWPEIGIEFHLPFVTFAIEYKRPTSYCKEVFSDRFYCLITPGESEEIITGSGYTPENSDKDHFTTILIQRKHKQVEIKSEILSPEIIHFLETVYF